MKFGTKNRAILPFNWRTELENIDSYSIDDDFILIDKPVIHSTFQYPFKVDVTATIICIKGVTEGSINLIPYKTDGPCLVTILPGHIMEYKSISEDFTGLIIVMSQKFSDMLMPNYPERLPLTLTIRDNPIVPLAEEELEGFIDYFKMMKRMIQYKDHPYRIEVARYLTLAFYYGAGQYYHKLYEKKKKSHHEIFVEKFLHLVQNHYKEQRGLDFYSNKLCVSTKHLSKVISAVSGKPASD